MSHFRRGQNWMGFAHTLKQRRRCFIKCALTVSAIILAASACCAQVAAVGQAPEVAWTQELNKYPGLLEEFGRLVKKLQANVQFPPPRRKSHLLRPDYIVGALDLATLRRFNSRLDRGGREFVSTPFGQRVVQGYEGGVTVLGAADVHKILSLSPPGAPQSESTFQHSGFADMKYLVWGHTIVTGREVSQGELTFVTPRHGAASWLAKPTLMGSLDFVSPKAMLAGTIVLTNPAQIFDDVTELARVSNPNAFATLAQAVQALKLSVTEDFLSHLGGEITLELDNVTVTAPIDTSTGTRSFCSTSDGVIHYKTSPPLNSPVSVLECRAWSLLQ